MATVPLPMVLSAHISQLAARYAREDMTGMNWSDRSIQAMNPRPGEGTVGLFVTQRYLMYQNRGFKPFVMWSLEGKTIPMKDGFRVARGVGQPGYVTLPGGVRKWRDQKWRHPGLPPKNFMEKAIRRAIADSAPQLQQILMHALRGGRDEHANPAA